MWSAGCIFAELLGRRVLFKGNDYVDQLKKIIGVLGLPQDTTFWDETTSESVIEYIRNLRNADGCPPPTECIDFTTLFPTCPADGIDLMMALLQLDPKKRLTAESALSHPYVAEMRDPAEEMACPVQFDFDSFEYIEDQDQLRGCIVNEVMAFKHRSHSDDMDHTDDDDDDDDNADDIDDVNDRHDNDNGDRAVAAKRVDHRYPSLSSSGYGDSLMATDGSTARSNSNRTTLSAASSTSSSTRVNSTNALSRRRYTGGSISTPISASATEAHLYALAAVQEGRDVPIIIQDNSGVTTIMGSDQIVGEPEDMDEDDIQVMNSDESIQIDYQRRLLDPSDTDVQAIERHLSRDW
jgi:mitogen-activated protein kinase 7